VAANIYNRQFGILELSMELKLETGIVSTNKF